MFRSSHSEKTAKQENQKLSQKSVFAFSYILEASVKTAVSRLA